MSGSQVSRPQVDYMYAELLPDWMILVIYAWTTSTDYNYAHQVLGTHLDRPSWNSPGALWPRKSSVNEVTVGASQVKTVDRGLRGVEQVEHRQGASHVKTGEGLQGLPENVKQHQGGGVFGLLGVEQVKHHQGGGGGVFQASGPQPNKISGPTSGWV